MCSVWQDSNEFAFHDAASKVTATVTIFRKSLLSL
jgi:hypothetical protein